MKRSILILFFIIILGSILRLYRLGDIPKGLEWDEVALGYDAFSILKTGRDQFGTYLPISFRSLDDFKPPLYVYTAIPPVFIFGLTEFATRFPSAAFGVIAIIMTYFLCMEMFSDLDIGKRRYVALLSALFLAISPWHLQFSRAAFETNLSVTVTIIAVLCFLKGIKGYKKTFFLSSFFFGLSFFSYHSTRVVSPILFVSLFLIFRNKLTKIKNTVIFLLIYSVFVFFFIPIATSSDAQIRFRVTNDLNYELNEDKSAIMILQDKLNGSEIAGKIFHNRRISTVNYTNVKKIFTNYLSHFSPGFLVEKGDVPLHHAPGFGMIYFTDYPLIFAGIISFLVLYKRRRNLILFIWLLAGPIPASVTWQAPHAVRAEIILPTLQIFSALGLITLYNLFKKESDLIARVLISGLFLTISVSFAFYLHQYYYHTDYELSKNWIYGRKEAVNITEGLKHNFDKVIVSMKVDQPYIFWLYYSKYSPSKYLMEGGTVSGGFAEQRNRFDKYEFKDFRYSELTKDSKLLLVGLPEEFPPNAHILKTIYYINGTEALKVATND